MTFALRLVADLHRITDRLDQAGGARLRRAVRGGGGHGVHPATAGREGCFQPLHPGRKGTEEVMVGWVSSARHSLGTGTVPPHFAPEIAPDLLQLRSQLTKYKLGQASALRSIYSWRLLELLAQYEASGWRQINWTSFTTRCPPPIANPPKLTKLQQGLAGTLLSTKDQKPEGGPNRLHLDQNGLLPHRP